MTDTVTIINLEKVCAEYGFDMLKNAQILSSKNLTAINDDLKELKSMLNNNVRDNEIKEFVDKREKHYFSSESSEYNKIYIISWIFHPIKQSFSKDKTKIKKTIQEVEKNLKFSFQPETFENEITKALGILIEDGPFAYFIWLKSQDKEPHRAMLVQTARLLKDHLHLDINLNKDVKDALEDSFINKISSDLNMLILVKTLIERMLIYARYKAKAIQKEQIE